MSRAGQLIAALAVLLVSACGQKGPLYLPDKGGKVVTSAPATTEPAAATPATPATAATPATPATPATVKPTDKDKDQDSQPKP